MTEGNPLGQVHADRAPRVFAKSPNAHGLGGFGRGEGGFLALLHNHSKPSAGQRTRIDCELLQLPLYRLLR